MTLIVFDLETTSPKPRDARIVEAYIGALDDDGRILRERTWIIRPDGYTIPDEATAIHGISTMDALNDPAAQDGTTALGEMLDWLDNECNIGRLPLVGQNIAYDLSVLDREIERYLHPLTPSVQHWIAANDVTVLDTLVLDRHVDKYRKGSRKLIDMAAHYGVSLSAEEAHGARADAIAAGRIMLTLRKHQLVAGVPGDVLMEGQTLAKKEQAASLQKWLRENRDPDAQVDPWWPVVPRGR